jgi:hypothetical protein
VTLLYPDGSFYCGPLSAQFERHGAGVMHAPDGTIQARDRWADGQLADLSASDADGDHSDAISSSECVV